MRRLTKFSLVMIVTSTILGYTMQAEQENIPQSDSTVVTRQQIQNDEVEVVSYDSNQIMKDRYTIPGAIEDVPFVDEVAVEDTKEYIGEFTISHYCPCKTCNYPYTHTKAANGDELVVGYSVAVDPKTIPLNSIIEIEGYDGDRKAMDTGGKIKGNRIDVLVSDHKLAYKLGIKKKVKVYKIVE